MPTTESSGAVGKAIRTYFKEFGALKACGREYWIVQLVNLLDGVAYFAMLTVSTLYLSETLGYNDKDAALLWALCMAVYTGMGFFAGFLGDSLGIKKTLHLSIVLLVVSRLAISATTAKTVVLPSLFVIAIGTAIMTPILIAATKRYTTPKSQTAGFNMLYFLMNIGAFVGNVTLDPLRALPWGNRSVFMVGSAMSILCWLAILLLWRRPLAKVDAQAKGDKNGSSGETESKENGGKPDKEKWEAPWTIALSVIRESTFWRFMLFLVILVGVRLVFEHQYQVYPKYYIRTMSAFVFNVDKELGADLDTKEASDAVRDAFGKHDVALSGKTRIIVEATETLGWRVTDGGREFRVLASDYALDPGLRADLEAERITADVRAAFEAYLNVALSEQVRINIEKRGVRWLLKDAQRTYRVLDTAEGLRVYEASVPIGALNSINPLIICFGVILSTPIVARFKLFNVMFFGITISAVSMLFLVIPPTWICGLWGWTLPQGYALIVILQIVLFSIGEAIWSPRLYEYTAAIAPKGREASYMGLSYFPMFFARFAEGPLAGSMLTDYCPPDVTDRLATVSYSQSPQFMCLILAAIAIASPILIFLLRGVVQKGSRLERDEQLETNAQQ